MLSLHTTTYVKDPGPPQKAYMCNYKDAIMAIRLCKDCLVSFKKLTEAETNNELYKLQLRAWIMDDG
jgi:hypothetical protein